MRAHLATGPAANRAAITMFVPRGHPAHRVVSSRPSHNQAAQWLQVRAGLPAALAAMVCGLALLSVVLLGTAPHIPLASTSPVLPWLVAASAGPLAGSAARPVAPGLSGLPPASLAMTTIVFPAPHFIHLPYRSR